jgi:hypothetical protein
MAADQIHKKKIDDPAMISNQVNLEDKQINGMLNQSQLPSGGTTIA